MSLSDSFRKYGFILVAAGFAIDDMALVRLYSPTDSSYVTRGVSLRLKAKASDCGLEGL